MIARFIIVVAVAIAPAVAQSNANGEFSPPQAQDAPAASGPGSAALDGGSGVVDGVKQIGTGIGSIVTGVGRFLVSASNATATNGNPVGASSESVASQLGAEQREAYDKLAVGAAAQRLVAEAAFEALTVQTQKFSLAPRGDAKAQAKAVAIARRNLETEVAALKIAVAEFSNATGVLVKRYTGVDFGAYKALQASISSPIEVHAVEVAPDKPIYLKAEALALQIMAGTVPRAATPAAAPSRAALVYKNSSQNGAVK